MSLTRRTFLGVGLGTVAAATGCAEQPAWVEPAAPSPVAPFPRRVAATTRPSAAAAKPHPAAAPSTTARMRTVLTKYLKPIPDNPRHPGYAGAVALVQAEGRTTVHTAVGHALRDKAGPVDLPASRRVAMRPSPASACWPAQHRKTVLVLLTDRAHPNWSWSNPDSHRVAVPNVLA